MNFSRQDSLTDNLHLWGEEIRDGIVFNVYLRKVKYFNSITALQCTDTKTLPRTDTDPQLLSYCTTASLSGEEYTGIQWETRREYVIKSATLERLVEELTQAMNHMDSCFINIFLNTYQSFTSTEKILDLLLQRYTLASDRHSGPKSRSMKKGLKLLIRKSVQSVLMMWLDENPSDFREPPNYPCLTTLMDFAQNTMLNKELTERCRRKIERWKNDDEAGDGDSICSNSSLSSPVDNHQFTFSICEEVENMMNPREFHQMEEDHIAEQLTYIDAALFRRVVVPHCLGTIWSKRDKDDTIATTVKATVEQFNKVSYLVISTILSDPTLKASLRAKVITKWIHIAQECRNLKNFSSLKAILSGLQANCIHRLRRTWTAVPKDSVLIFEELSEIFSHENNHEVWREILMKEGTAKFVDKTSTIRSRTMRRKSLKKSELSSIMHGTIPYLGTFLTDLMMIHSAYPDDIFQNGYINFEKKRKEFELLAQIRLLQKAAQNYQIHSDKDFQKWIDGVKIYADEQSYNLSCIIEPLSPKTPNRKAQFSLGGTWRRRSAIFHWSSSGSSTGSEDGVSMSSSDSPAPGLTRMSRSSSCSSLSIELSSISSSSSLTPLSPRYLSPTSCAIKVSMEKDSTQGNIYKSILVNHEEHTPAVIATALCKYQKDEESISNYELVQILPEEEEMVIPEKCNVFYAINQSAPDLTFQLRKKLSPSEKRPVMKKRNSIMKLQLIRRKASTS